MMSHRLMTGMLFLLCDRVTNPQSSSGEWKTAARIKLLKVTLVSLKTTNIYRRQQDSVYIPTDVFKEVVVDLRKGFHLFA